MISEDSRTWRWIALSVVLAVHDHQLAEHGGTDGIRDLAALESALARPANLAAYSDPDVADLAASYAFELLRNHAFVDGNKRTAWVTARVFLTDDDRHLGFDPLDAIRIVEDVAAHRVSESELADWFRRRIVS